MTQQWGNIFDESIKAWLQEDKSTENSNAGQTQDGTKKTEVDYEKQYKELQGEFDRRNEASFQKDLKLAELNKKYILDVDQKTQNKLIKELYGYDNLEELTTMHGDNFYEDKGGDDGEVDEIQELKKKVKLMELKANKWATEDAIEAYVGRHEDVFKDTKALEKLRDELKYVSDNLSPKERVERAGKLAFGAYVDKKSDAYLALQEVQINKERSNIWVTPAENNSEIENIFLGRFWKKAS